MKFVRLIQLILILIPVSVFSWLVWQEFVPSGVFQVEARVGEANPFIDRILPDQRVDEVETDFEGDRVQTVFDDPAFFFVHPHRDFDTVEAEIWFKNDSVPIIELGGLAQIEGQVYDLKPLQNKLIDDSQWMRLDSNGITLLQREHVYDSVADFIVDPPDRHEIATYHYSLARPYFIEGYAPSDTEQLIDVSLRGFHTFKTYIKDEPLNFDIMYMDMNRAEGPDALTILVTNENGNVVTQSYALDDGNTTSDGMPSTHQTISVFADELPEGVYKVELRAERDIFFRQIRTKQQKLVFLDNVYVADEIAWQEPARPVQFWTEAKSLAFQTQHADGVQEIQLEGEVVSVEEPYKRYAHHETREGVIKVVVPRADMMVHTDGHIAFSPNQFFNPDPVRLGPLTDLDALGVNYVVANYTSPEQNGNWLVARAEFDVDVLVLDWEAWKFTFSTPEIKELEASFDVGKIRMNWIREPFKFSDLFDGLKRAL